MSTPPEVAQDQNLYANLDGKEPYMTIPQFYSGRSVFVSISNHVQ